jgi:NADH-quinone oxidoreductase subunit G
MIKLFIDGAAVEVPEGTTVFKAAEQGGIELPHFCFHPAFAPEGSCRLCLIQIEGSPKLELGCSTIVREGMKVVTQSPAVREARRGVLEFLLAEHPLDCPICDKAGECKLQDYSRDYGLTESVFREFKEKRDKKVAIGEKLLLDRERCIQCTRCVRFLAEITKSHELGVFERGVHAEIGILEGGPVRNGYSGNLVDLCPVGAITDTDFRFKTRPWFLSRGESVCPHCDRGCNIYVDYQPGFPRVPGSAKVFRIRPRTNEAVNGPWICDAGRYGYVRAQNEGRSDRPFWNKDGAKTELAWDTAMAILGDKLRALADAGRSDRVAVVATSWLTNEELFLLKKIFRDDFGAGRIVLCDPQPGEGDDFLHRPDRTPNARGARELGFDPAPPTLEALARGTEVLILFGPHIAERFAADELCAALRGIAVKVLVTPHFTGLEGLMDGVLASATPAEKDGSFTNFEGRVQPFAAAARPCPDVRSELAILAALAGSLGLRPDYYGRLTTAAAVRRELAKDIPFFGGAA